MRASRKIVLRLILGAACLQVAATAPLRAGTVPVAESFESYDAGDLITDQGDWDGVYVDAGVVSTNVAAIDALVAYTNASGTFPLPQEPHAKVLELSAALTNTVSSATGGVVIAEWLVMPALRDGATEGSTNHQVAFYVNTDSDVVIWRRDLLPTPTNAWLTLTGSPTIDTSTWTRVTVTLDYVTDRFQLAIDGTAISDAEGEKRDGDPNGSWFHMVQTNSYMSRFHAGGEKLAYLDDLVFTNRTVSYSGTTFTEDAIDNGNVSETKTITLSGDAFVAGPYNSGTHFTATGVPSGLAVALAYVSPTELTMSLTGTASPHTVNEGTSGMELTLEDDIFALENGADVDGSTTTFAVTLHDGLGVAWPNTTFTEAAANNGTIGNEITLTLVGDTFVDDGAFNTGDEYTISAGSVPGDLGLSITYLNSTQVKLALTNAATSHDGGSGGFTLAFQNGAFTSGDAGAVPNASQALTVTFLTQPVLTYSGTAFAEASNNNGTIGNTQTATLVGTTLAKSGALTLNTDYTITSGAVPGTLALSINSDGTDELTLSLGSSTSPHTSLDNGSFEVTFADALFANVAASDIAGSSESLSVTFDDQPTISYSGTVFSELAGGLINNNNPIEITLDGDTFTGANGSDFVADGKVTTNNVPAGLTLTLTKSSNTKLLARLTGAATENDDPDDDVDDLTITFKDSAFAADAAQVTGYSKTNLEIDFNNNTLAINTPAYSESFESYDDGYTMGMAQGWQPHGSPVVTTETAIVSALTSGFSEFPIDTTHTKVLRVTEETTDEILSASGGDLYTDCMLYMVARDEVPPGSASYQVAFYVNSSEKLVLWHDAGSGGEWLETATTVTTSTWHRFTVKQDQSNFRYRLYVDGAVAPVADAVGYADRTGAATSGSWFGMVNTNGFMSRVRLIGGDADAPTYLDDLVVKQTKPEYLTGTLFMFR